MTTQEYINQVRDLTGFSDYKIAKEYKINQSNLSKYSSGKSALSETHAFLFANILGLNPTIVMIDAKIEQAKNTNSFKKLKFWQEQLKNLKSISDEAKIVISQFNPIVGDINGNTVKIIKLIKQASGNDLIIFPELAICGYPPEDLLIHHGFMEEITKHLTKIIQYSKNIDIVIGAPRVKNGKCYNSAFLLRAENIAGIYDKKNLPNYGIFDEKRYFESSDNHLIFNLKAQLFSIIICEDTWSQDIIKYNKNIGVNTIISINASPFSKGKYQQRLDMVGQNIKKNKLNLIYVNMVGAQDGVVFDGGSFYMNETAEITNQLPFFAEITHNLDNQIYHTKYNELEVMYQALVLGLKEYMQKNSIFDKVIVSLSGGIDSALTLAIAVDAFGYDNVSAIMMPYFYTSSQSILDAKTQATKMKVSYTEININKTVDSIVDRLSIKLGDLTGSVALENIQARTRAVIAMAIANQENKLLLTTGNKSEMAVGYATLYGDMAGGYAPIKDVYKSEVYKLANYRNSLSEIIPLSVLNKEPSAELAPNQLDSNTLPPYNVLDKILILFIDQRLSIQEIINHGFDEKLVYKIINMVKNTEYKRNQSAIGTKISANAFDKERRYPLTNKFTF